MREFTAAVREDGGHTFVALPVLDVHREDHCLPVEPLVHNPIKVDLVSNVVGQLHNNILHDVQHDHLNEVTLLEGFRQDDLVRHLSLLVTVVLDYLLLTSQLFVSTTAV